jgi:hypothetical protein
VRLIQPHCWFNESTTEAGSAIRAAKARSRLFRRSLKPLFFLISTPIRLQEIPLVRIHVGPITSALMRSTPIVAPEKARRRGLGRHHPWSREANHVVLRRLASRLGRRLVAAGLMLDGDRSNPAKRYKPLTNCLISSRRRTAHHERTTATSIGAPLFIV